MKTLLTVALLGCLLPLGAGCVPVPVHGGCEACDPDPAFEPLITERDSGGTSVVRGGTFFVVILDARRGRPMLDPPGVLTPDRSQSLGSRTAWTYRDSGRGGIVRLTATGPGLPPFRQTLVIGDATPYANPRGDPMVMRSGQILVVSGDPSTHPDPGGVASPVTGWVPTRQWRAVSHRVTDLPSLRAYRLQGVGMITALTTDGRPSWILVLDPAPLPGLVFVALRLSTDPPGVAGIPTGSMVVGAPLVIALPDGTGPARVEVHQPAGLLEPLPRAVTGPWPQGYSLFAFTIRSEGHTSLAVSIPGRVDVDVPINAEYDCNDAEFPPYRHAADRGALVGGRDECTGFEYTSDSPAAVLADERSELAAGDWELVGATTSTLSFRRRSNPSVTATLTVHRSDDPAYRTRIDFSIRGQPAA